MTTPFRPLIRTQGELETAWRELIQPLGFHRRSLWLLLIDGDDRPTPVITEITDLPPAPGDETLDGLAQALLQLAEEVPGGRWALLLSRPGRHAADGADLTWAAQLYDTLRRHHIAHAVVHLATDDTIGPIPLDDLTGYLRAS